MKEVKNSPPMCGKSKYLYGVYICKDKCAPCPVVYKENGICAIDEVNNWVKAFKKMLDDIDAEVKG